MVGLMGLDTGVVADAGNVEDEGVEGHSPRPPRKFRYSQLYFLHFLNLVGKTTQRVNSPIKANPAPIASTMVLLHQDITIIQENCYNYITPPSRTQ